MSATSPQIKVVSPRECLPTLWEWCGTLNRSSFFRSTNGKELYQSSASLERENDGGSTGYRRFLQAPVLCHCGFEWRLGNGNLGLPGTPSDLPDKVANHRGHHGTVHFHLYMEQAGMVMRVWEPENLSCCTPSERFPPIQMYPTCSLQCVCE